MNATTLVSPGWFRIAVQALVVIATTGAACPSATIAEGVEAHAVFLRRVLAQLARSQIVEAREGRGGGYRLARPAHQITLAEVFEAVRPGDAPDDALKLACTGTRVQDALDEIAAEAEQRVVQLLATYTLSTIVERSAPVP